MWFEQNSKILTNFYWNLQESYNFTESTRLAKWYSFYYQYFNFHFPFSLSWFLRIFKVVSNKVIHYLQNFEKCLRLDYLGFFTKQFNALDKFSI